MHEIFISYSSKHRDLTRELAAVLEEQYGQGSVWWDQELEARGPYDEQIQAALDTARVVVVIWTTDAAISRWVKAEAARAQRQAKLVNVRPSDVSGGDLPMPFNLHHVERAEDRDRILAIIAKTWRGEPIPTANPLDTLYEYEHGRPLIDPKKVPLPANALPSELLQAKYALVPYDDVTGMGAELLAWCTAGPHSAAGRLIHGPGGIGKSRLLIRVAEQLRQQGWRAGFLDRPHTDDKSVVKQRLQALDQRIRHGDDHGLLLVLDYAENRQDELVELAGRLGQRLENCSRPIRLVLLARSAGEWWERLVEEHPELDRIMRHADGQPHVTKLSVIPEPRQRRDLFAAAREAFAPVLAAQGYTPPAGDPPAERLQRLDTNDDFERPLAVQMEALLSLTSAAPGVGATGVDKLLDRILGLERAHWQKLLGTLGEEGVRDLGRGVGQVTLVQGVESRPAAELLLMADTFYDNRKSRAAVDPLVRNLRRLYGRADDGIAQLEPDLIGEHHVADDKVGDAELVFGCLAWVETEPEELRPQHRRDLLTVMQRATQPEHGARAVGRAESMLDIVITEHSGTFAAELVGVMIDTPGSLAQRLDRWIDELGERALAAIDAYLPLQSLSLMGLSLRIADRRAVVARALVSAIDEKPDVTAELRETGLNHLADRVGTLGVRLSDLGRREEALAASQEAVKIYRRLAATRPDDFLPGLALSLNNNSAMLSALGRRKQALAASREAVKIRRRLAAARPDDFLPDLARSLSNIGLMLSDLGRRKQALAASQEAVEIRRRLAAARPGDFMLGLAASLNNLGLDLSDLGRREEALAASQEAVEIRRRLAAARPDDFLPDLARSVSALSDAFAAVDRHEEAAQAATEALDILVPFVERYPQAFGQLGRAIASSARKHTDAAGLQPDAALLQRVAQAIARGQPG